MKRFLAFGFIALWLAWVQAQGQATDTYVAACAANSNCVLASNVSWVNGNQVWRFTAWQQNESIRIWILNRNTTSAHTTQTVKAFATDEGNVSSFNSANDRWTPLCITNNTVAGAQLTNVAINNPAGTGAVNGKGTGYTVGMYAVQIAIQITGAVAAAGSPDTFDIGIVQQPNNYPGGPQPGCDPSAGGASNASMNLAQVNGVAVPSTGADTVANTTQPLPVADYVFNGATWDRMAGSTASPGVVGILTATAPTDALANASVGLASQGRGGASAVATTEMLFNGTTWDRQRSGAAGYTAQTALGVALTRPKEIATFSTIVSNITPAATPTDVLEFCGNGTTTAQILRWEVGFTATAAPAANIPMLWLRRSSADTGGTPNLLGSAQYDTSDPGSSSAPRQFTANPATGVFVSNLKVFYITPDNILSNSDPQNVYLYSQTPGAKPWTVRGATQCIYLNLQGATLPAGFSMSSTIEWIERTDI